MMTMSPSMNSITIITIIPLIVLNITMINSKITVKSSNRNRLQITKYYT